MSENSKTFLKSLQISKRVDIFMYLFWYTKNTITIMAVIQITSREFRDKQASMFALADKGMQVVIRRRGKVSYMLTPVYSVFFAKLPI